MNKYSLTLKSSSLEKEYHAQQIQNCKRQSYPLLLIYLAIALTNLIFLTIDYISDDTKSSNNSHRSSSEFYTVLSFLIMWVITIVMSFILLRQMPEKFNIFYSIQQIINILYHMVVIYYKLNISGSIYSNYSDDDINNSSSNQIQFHFLEGFLLAIFLTRGFISTLFILKASLFTFSIVGLLFISYDSQERPYIQIPIGLASIAIVISQMYEEDKKKRQDFLMRRKDTEWNKIIKNVLPTTFLIAKYNSKESRVELVQANKKANRELGITNSDTFQKFTKSTYVQNNEIISNEKDLNRILKFTQQNINNNQASQNVNINSQCSKDLTLYSLIRNKIDEEIRKKRNASICSLKKSSTYININIHDEIDVISETTMYGVPQSMNRPKKKSIGSNQPSQSQNGNNQNAKKISEYIGSYRPNGFDVDKKLLIRVSTFSLNEIYAVITIENETYRDKYINQIKFSTFLEKIFSFQLKKFKLSYLTVLKELKRVNNLSLMNELLYENVKCMNRVNSYLQYFEFKNSNKQEFTVREFNVTQEILKILRCLKYQIVAKQLQIQFENVSQYEIISTDEERFQQIFFQLFEHLIVNSPIHGYIAIRITDDVTISNSFRIQIQSTYQSNLLNQLNLQTFNIDQLYNDYEVYQNYFVSLRIAFKQITLMGPYNKIDFKKSDKGLLFMSFSIFSNLEVIRQSLNKPNYNISSYHKVHSSSNFQQQQQQQQLQQLSLQQQHSQDQNLQGGISQNYTKYNQSEYLSVLKPHNNKHDGKQDSIRQDQITTNKNSNSVNLHSPQSDNSLQESGNLSEVYDEESSFNQWLKLKQLKASSMINQKVFSVINSHLPNPALKQSPQQDKEISDLQITNKANFTDNNNNINSPKKPTSALLTSDILDDQRESALKRNSFSNSSPTHSNISQIIKDSTLAAQSTIPTQNKKVRTIQLNEIVEGEFNLPYQTLLYGNSFNHKNDKHQTHFIQKIHKNSISNLNQSQAKLVTNGSIDTTIQLMNKTNSISYSRQKNSKSLISQTKHPNHVSSALELGQESDIQSSAQNLKYGKSQMKTLQVYDKKNKQ